ncbi:MAG: EI24 domain-containing protein [Terricaulis sp.]
MDAAHAILGGLGDVFQGRLSRLAMVNLVVAAALTVAGAWAIMHFVVPLIPTGTGWLGPVSAAGAFAANLAAIVLAVALSPAVSMAVGGALFDLAVARIERQVGLAEARSPSLREGLLNGLHIAGLPLALNLISLPVLFVPVVNFFWFLALNGYLMGREYFSLAALRRMSWEDARDLRRRHRGAIFAIGLFAAILPFVAPLFGASAMTRLIKRCV